MQYINDALSNTDLHKAIIKFDKKGANIIADENISPNTSAEDIFKDRGHVIVFHRYPNELIGHWYSIIRDRNKNVFFMDSFGEHPDFYCKYMLPALKKGGVKNVFINKKKMQGEDTSICGRYGLVLCTLNKLGLGVDDIYKFLENGKKKHKSYDKFILELTT